MCWIEGGKGVCTCSSAFLGTLGNSSWDMPACPQGSGLSYGKGRKPVQFASLIPSHISVTHSDVAVDDSFEGIPLAEKVLCGPENRQRICRSKTLCFIFNEVQQVMRQNKHAIKE